MKAKYLLTEEELAAGKRIKMPKAKLARWLEALRDPSNKQGRATLFNPATKGFCCLGLEQAANNGGCVEGDGKHFRSFPSLYYLRENGIHFAASVGGSEHYNPELAFRNGLRQSASGANDSGKNFRTIAAAISRVAVGY